MRVRLPRRSALGIAAAIAAALMLVVGGVLAARLNSGTGAGGPLDDDTVVATLQTGPQATSPEVRAALRAVRDAPGDARAAKRAARLLIEEGRAAGDSRLVGAALGVLRPVLAAPDAEALILAATARQYQHDFPGALGLLDRAIALDPRDADALLTRATIQVVLGRFETADEDCRRLHALRRPDLGFLCQSTALTLTAEAPVVYKRLDAILAQGGVVDASLRSYAQGLMGEVAALQGWDDLARTHLAAALEADPAGLRLRIMLADVLLEDDDAAAAFALLDGVPEVDAVLLRRAIAARRLGRGAVAMAAEAELARRFRQNIDLGLKAHAREETLFYLRLAPDFGLALDRALVNWNLQHEIEDAQLLLDAAAAAGRPEAAAPVLDWIAEAGVSVPTLRIPDAVREAAQ